MHDGSMSVLDLVAHPVFVVEPDASLRWRCSMMNEAARQALKCETSEDLRQLFPGRTGAGLIDNCGMIKRTGRVLRFEQKLELDGEMRLIQMSLRPDTGEDGEISRIIGSWTDVTDQRYLRARQGEEIDAGKEDMIFVAAYDLREPIQRVSEAADRLRDGFQDLGDGKLELIDLLESTSTNALDLIGDVLAHVEAQSAGAPRVQFNLGDMIKKTMRMLDPDGTFQCDYSSVEITCDQTVMQCVLRNLINNSMRFATADDTSAHLSFSVEAAGDGHVRLLYEDNGSDFDPDMFFDAPNAMFGHHGLGLLAMRRVVHNQGGTITAGHGQNGTGARVMVALPGQIVSASGRAA